MIWSNKNKKTTNVKPKKVLHRLLWGFGALTSGIVPLVLSTGCAYELRQRDHYVVAPDQITQDLGIASISDIPNEISSFNAKNPDEQIDHLFGNGSSLVSSYIQTFVAIPNGTDGIDYVLTLAPGFVFKGTQQNKRVFSWTLRTLSSRNIAICAENIPPKKIGEDPGPYCDRIRRDFCAPFNASDSISQKIAIAFGNYTELNVRNTKSITATVDRDNKELDFNVVLKSGHTFSDTKSATNSNSKTFRWSFAAPLVKPTDYYHFLVVNDLNPTQFALAFNHSPLKTQQGDLLVDSSTSSFTLKSARATANANRCEITFKLANKSGPQSPTSNEFTCWVISRNEFDKLCELMRASEQKTFDVGASNFFKTKALQTLDFFQLNRELQLNFPDDLTFALFLKNSSFQHDISGTTQEVNLTCEISLYPYKGLTNNLPKVANDSFCIKLNNVTSLDIQSAVKICKQYSYTLEDSALLADGLAQVLAPSARTNGFDYTTITLKSILSHVYTSLSNILCRDSKLLSTINDSLKDSGSISGFNLIELEPFIQRILTGAFQNQSVNTIIKEIVGPSPTIDISLPSAVSATESLLTDPTLVGDTLTTLFGSNPVLSFLKGPIGALVESPWWKYAIDANINVLIALLPKLLDTPSLDLIDGVLAIYLAETISYLPTRSDDKLLAEIRELLSAINSTLYGISDKTFNSTVYITDKNSHPFKTATPSPVTKKSVGFNLDACAYRNLLAPNVFLRSFLDLCQKRIKTLQRNGKTIDIAITPAVCQQLKTFGFIIDSKANEGNTVSFTFNDDAQNPTITMQISDKGVGYGTTVLSLTNLQETLGYWVNSSSYKQGLFNVSFYDSLIGNKHLLAAILKFYAFSKPELLFLPLLPGIIEGSSLTGGNCYDLLHSIICQIESNVKYQYAKKLVFSHCNYNLIYNNENHQYVFSQEYTSSQPDSVKLNIKSLKTILDPASIFVFVRISDFLTTNSEVNIPIAFSFKNTLCFSRFDLLNNSTRLIQAEQELNFDGISNTIDHIFGFNLSGKNQEQESIFNRKYLIPFLGKIGDILDKKFKPLIVDKSPVTGREEYKKLDQIATIDFFN